MPGHFFLLSLTVRGLLVMALLAIAPLYWTAHVMSSAAGTPQAMLSMAATERATAAMPDRVPAQHFNHDAGCHIPCYGWVEAAPSERGDGPAIGTARKTSPTDTRLVDGLAPVPSGHPPKPLNFV